MVTPENIIYEHKQHWKQNLGQLGPEACLKVLLRVPVLGG